jgi:predicted Zn-dependent protease
MRKTIVILLCCTVLLLLGYSGYRAYELWKKNHWMTLAKDYLAKGDNKNEFLCLEQVLQLNPRDIEGCRMMANLAELSGSQSAMAWRKKVVELDPNSIDDRLALAQTAVFAHDYTTATTALAAVEAAGKKNAVYYNIMGQIALGSGNPGEAEADFNEAIRLDPSNPAPQLSMAVVQLHGTNSLDMAEARITLRRISMNPTNAAIAMQAEREIVTDALRFRDNNTALWYSKELLQQPNPIFYDKLLRLDALKATGNAEYDSALTATERQAESNTANLYDMVLWFIKHNMPPQAISWMQTLPANTQTNMPVAMLSAQCQMLVKNWSALQNSISRENWGSLEYMRQAYSARALREQGLYEASKAQWDIALKSANGQDENLQALFRMTAAWNWQEEAQQILWSIVNNYPQEEWAEIELGRLLLAGGNTRPLLELYSMEANRTPSDLDARNDLALIAMLLHAQEMSPYDVARQVYQAAPTNSTYASTYAFALYLQGKNPQALKIMQQLSARDLKNRSIAGYYGLILKAAGDNARAMSYLTYAIQGELLPEERTLFQRALAGS